MEYISRIEKGEYEKGKYELVVRCDDYKDFQKFQDLIRSGMNGNVENKNFTINTLRAQIKCKEEDINSLKCELSARAKETEELKGELLHLKELLKEKDNITSENKCASCKCKSETQKSKANENLTDAEITLLKIASISDNPLYLLYVYNYFTQK